MISTNVNSQWLGQSLESVEMQTSTQFKKVTRKKFLLFDDEAITVVKTCGVKVNFHSEIINENKEQRSEIELVVASEIIPLSHK